jgi:hypothetical protein
MKNCNFKNINFRFNSKGEEIADCPFCKIGNCRVVYIPAILAPIKIFLKCFDCGKKFSSNYDDYFSFIISKEASCTTDAVFYG